MPRNGRYKPAMTGAEKQRRFQARHPGYSRRYYRPRDNPPGRPPVWCIYSIDGKVFPCRWWEVPCGVLSMFGLTMPKVTAVYLARWLNRGP